MEIDISDFYKNAAPKDYAASRAEIGQDAGRATWLAALEDSDEYWLLDDEEKREAFRGYIKGLGAWDAEEIASMSNLRLNAMLIQFVAGDMRGDQDRILVIDGSCAYYYLGD